MPPPISLVEHIHRRKQRYARRVRRDLFDRARTLVNDFGDDIESYALVVWGRNGSTMSAIGPDRGEERTSVGYRAVPHFVENALQQHVSARPKVEALDEDDA